MTIYIKYDKIKKIILKNKSYLLKVAGEVQMNKLFRNCPNENEVDCRNCYRYRLCLIKKEERRKARKKRKIRKIRNFLIWSIAILLLIILTVLFFFMPQKISADEVELQVVEEPLSNLAVETFNNSENIIVSKVQKIKQPKISPIVSMEIPVDIYKYDLSDEDKLLIAKLVYQEARGECFEGQIAVAAVVLNRYYYGEKYYGDFFDNSSIYSIITQAWQFADINSVTEWMLSEYPDCKYAVEAACRGIDPTKEYFENGAFFFFAPDGVTGLQAKKREGIDYLQIGNHRFHNDFAF